VNIASDIDPAVGFHITAKPAQPVVRGQPLATIFTHNQQSGQKALRALRAAIPIVDEEIQPLPLVSHRVTANGAEELK
jgi:thymidine phosphorylase